MVMHKVFRIAFRRVLTDRLSVLTTRFPINMTGDTRAIVTCFLIFATIAIVNGQLLSTEHRTHAASERVNDLWCYQCHMIEDGERCSNLTGNYSAFEHKCTGDRRTCTVMRFSYTTSTEDSTSSPQIWSIERKCTSKCEPGCIVIGERTKLFACTTCCEQSFCNVGTGAANDLTIKGIDLFLALVLQITLTVIMYPS